MTTRPGTASKTVLLSYDKIKKLAFAFLALPLFMFLVFFVRLYISIPISLVLILILIISGKRKHIKTRIMEEPDGVRFNIWLLILIGVIVLIWCYLGGQGGFFYQTKDWFARNAVFRDLIRYAWPPYYDVTDSILCYYVGHWLPSAAIGRCIFLLFGNLDLAWAIGNILLGLWTALGCYISILLLIVYLKPQKTRFIIMAVLLMIFFSGLDIVGWIKDGKTLTDILATQHLEWWQWYPQLQFSSNTTCLYWVFNQSTAAWVGTLCFLNEKGTGNYGVIITCCMVSSILPSIGMAFIMILMILFRFFSFLREKKAGTFLKELFSVQNILFIVLAVPVLYFYYSMNTTLNNNTALEIIRVMPYKKIAVFCAGALVLIILFIILSIIQRKKGKNRKFGWIIGLAAVVLSFALSGFLGSNLELRYFWFLVLEAGLYYAILFPNYYKEPIYYISACTLIIIPAIQVGTNSDFCMRASIPGLIILMALCGKKLVQDLGGMQTENKNAIKKVTSYVLIVVLVIGMVTPVVEIWRGIHNCIEKGTIMLTDDYFYTMNRYDENGIIPSNFVSINYRDTIFYNYIIQ